MSVGQAVRKRKADQAVDSGEQELLELLSQTGWPLADESRGWENDIPRRSLQTSIVLPPSVLLHCPPLSPIRPYPSLFAKYLYNETSSKGTTPRSTSRSPSYPLPLPSPITLVPYTYGRPTLISRSHDPRYFLVYWPRLSDDLSSRLSQLASNAATGSISSSGGPSGSNRPDPSPENNFLQDERATSDQGGVLALYTRPTASSRKVTFFYTYEVHSFWTTDYNPITCRWLFEPRQWDAKTVRSGLKVDTEVNGMSLEDDQATNGHAPSSQPNGLPNGNGSEREEPNVRFFRTPFRGPRPVVTRDKESSPLGFVVLFANHHLNFYSTLHALPLVNNGLGLHGDDNPLSSYPKLEILSCPLLTPSTVLTQAAPPLSLDGISDPRNPSGTATKSASRLILPGQASIDIRPGDETVWVGFRSYRPRKVWYSVQGEDTTRKTHLNGSVNASAQGGRNGPIDLMTGVAGDGALTTTRRIGTSPRSVFRASDKEGEEEDWVDVVEVRLDLQENVFSMNARPIPRIRFPDTAEDSLASSGFRLTGLMFTEPSEDRPDMNGSREPVVSESDEVDHSSDPERPLGLVLALSASNGKQSGKTSLVAYRISKRNVALSDAFANLGSPTLPAKKLDLAGLGRAEWITHQTRTEDINGRLAVVEGTLSGNQRGLLAVIELRTSRLGRTSTKLFRLDVDHLELGELLFQTNETVSELSTHPDGTILFWAAPGEARIRIDTLDADPSTLDLNRADQACLAILNGDIERGTQTAVFFFGTGQTAHADLFLGSVWKRLCRLSEGPSPSMIHVASFLRLQYGIFRSNKDERAENALFILESVRALQLFTSTYRSTESGSKGETQGQPRQHSYDISGFWLLLSHMKWYLGVIRDIMREAILAASGRLPSADRPSPLQFMINPISRRILRDLHYHAQAFAIFGTRCGSPLPVHPAFGQTGQIDLASTQLAQADLREGFHAAGVSIGALSKIYDSFEELTTTEAGEISPQEWMDSLFLAYTLPDTAEGLEARIITHLTTNQKIIKHQSSVFSHEAATIEIGDKHHDIITKEALPASTTIAQRQYRQMRACTLCGSRSAIWQVHLTPDGLLPPGVMPAISETDDLAAKWHQRWQIHCICGGSWQPVV